VASSAGGLAPLMTSQSMSAISPKKDPQKPQQHDIGLMPETLQSPGGWGGLLNWVAHPFEFRFSKRAASERCRALPAKKAGSPTNRGEARRYKVKGARLRKRPLQVRCARQAG
jgi:hypothetical protein